MVRPSHEFRIDGAVDPGSLGIGETVEVRTRMGAMVARGAVSGQTPFGIILKEGDVSRNFFSRDFYLFFPEAPKVESVASNLMVDSHPDARVRARLGVFEQGEEEAQADAQDDSGGAEQPADDAQGAAGSTGANTVVDVNKLPQDIQNAVKSVNSLDDDQVNYILAQAGQALVGSLRRSNVSEAELHGLVQKSQNAIYKILTGRPAKQWKAEGSRKK